jgi:hypothetical protein
MQQVAQFVSGERDYTKMEGDTGPLVYPAAHVYVYTGLYYLTNKGKDIFLAQQLFAVLYMATLALVMLCYRQAKVRQDTQPPRLLDQLLTYGTVFRSHHTFSRSLYSRNGYTVSLSSGASMIVSPPFSSGLRFTASSGDPGQLEAWRTLGAWESRCPCYWFSPQSLWCSFWAEASRVA